MNLKAIKSLFIISALYDFILGVIFLLGFRQIYHCFNIVLPNHDGYVQFGAALVAIFGVGFWFVAQDPQRNRDIVKMGILLKVSYSGVVFYHAALGNLPGMWLPFAWLDIIFLIFFVIALKALKV